MSGLGHNEASQPSPDGGSAAQARATPPLFSKRARQIRADEGVVPSLFNRVKAMHDSTPFNDFSDPSANRPARGRARAGTLPSSWGNSNLSSLPQIAQIPITDADLSHFSGSSTPSHLGHNFHAHRHHSTAHYLGLSESATYADTSQNNNRLRSGSLTLPVAGFGNAFGPSIFSSNWQPSPSGLSSLTMSGDDHMDSSHSPTVLFMDDDCGARDVFDDSKTLDYLGLADTTPVGARSHLPHDLGSVGDATHSSARNRALTLATSLARPRMAPIDGRARSSSFLPGLPFENVADKDETGLHRHMENSQASMPLGHQNSLASAALHNRLSQYGGNRPGDHDKRRQESASSGARPRATSMSVLDAPLPSPTTSQGISIEIDAEAIRTYALENNIDPNDFLSFAQTASSAGSLGLGGRHRAGTIVALSGPGGRQRTEQELLRMSQAVAQKRSHKANALSGGYTSESTSPDNTASMTSRYAISTLTTTAVHTPGGSTAQTPTRSLYIGHLDSTVTGQDLMQAFGPYGAIESLRLLPDKNCGFVNFVELQDAVKAKEDVMSRMGGRIGLKTISPDVALRIGYGKIDVAPQGAAATSNSFAARGLASPRVGSPGVEGIPGTPSEMSNGTPTRALWIGSIPANTTISTLLSIFAPFGPIESARVLSPKNCGFVNFERVDDAIRARKALNGREMLGAEVGIVRVGFAKVPTKNQEGGFQTELATPEFAAAVDTLTDLKGAGIVPADKQLMGGNLESYRSNMVLDLLEKQRLNPPTSAAPQAVEAKNGPGPTGSRLAGFQGQSSSNSIVPSSDKGGVPLPMEMRPQATTSDLQLLMRELDENDADLQGDLAAVAQPRPPLEYYTKIPLVSEVSSNHRFDTARLRDLRKSIEAGSCTQVDVDNIAKDFLADLVDLSSDYIGNTLVQKFFEKCSEPVQTLMLEVIAPHLAMIGIHKNGTWAAQKIIDCAKTPEQQALIARQVQPYVPPLLLDQFGNYVVQCLLPFRAPQSDFIFDSMIDRCWEVAQGRYGARSMRACLESSGVSKLQQKRVAIAIILNSVPLATSQNGALLVTWLLDTSTFPGRFRLLVPRFIPHLAGLCTHKLASLTVLRIIGQRIDPEASQEIVKALLDPKKPQILEEVLRDQIHGSQFVSKLLTSSPLEPQDRGRCAERVSHLMVEHNLVGVPAYKQLVEVLGLGGGARKTTASFNGSSPALPAANAGILPPHAVTPTGSYNPGVPHPPVPAYPSMGTYGDGVMDLNLKMAQMTMQQQQQAAARMARPDFNPASNFGRPPLYNPIVSDDRRTQSFRSPAILRSLHSDAFNPWASEVLSPPMPPHATPFGAEYLDRSSSY